MMKSNGSSCSYNSAASTSSTTRTTRRRPATPRTVHLVQEVDEVEAILARLRDVAARTSLEEGPDTSPQSEFVLPPWFDKERYSRGAETFERNIFMMFGGKMSGLLSLLAVPSIVRLLAKTKKSGVPDTAFRRYVDTIRHMLFWYRSDLTDPNSPARESLHVVRNHHTQGSCTSRRSGFGGITQLDLALTQFAFCGFVVLRRKLMGIRATAQDLLDFLHVWRTIGYLIGIQDRFNLCCFDTDLAQSDRLFAGVCSDHLAPALTSPPEEFDAMSHALLDGMWCMMPVIEYETYLRLTQELAGVSESECLQPKGVWRGLLMSFMKFVPRTLSWPVIGHFTRAYHNVNMRFSIYMSTYHPLLAWYSFPGSPNNIYRRLVSQER